MPQEVQSFGARVLDDEIDRLWAEIAALRAALASATGGTVNRFVETTIVSPAPPVTADGTILVAETDESPLIAAKGIVIDPADGLYLEESDLWPGWAMLRAAVVKSAAKSGETGLTGDVTLSEGANVTLTQVGQNIAIAASGSGFDVTFVELGPGDDPYTLTAPGGEGVVSVKNVGSGISIRILPPSGHTFIENTERDLADTEYDLPPGWSVGLYYPGSGTVWRCVWFWFPTIAQTQWTWYFAGGGGYVPPDVTEAEYGDLDLTDDGDYVIDGTLLVLPEPGGASMSLMAGLTVPEV